MQAGKPSATAYGAAYSRARHQVVDAPLVFEDPLALRIVGEQAAERLLRDGRRTDGFSIRSFRVSIVARARIAEDELREGVASRGVRQYVVLGAGLDTFAYRNPYPSGSLAVFEVDHPATQTWKRQMLQAARIPEPSSVRYVEIDFEKQRLFDRLESAGWRPDVPTAFSWVGVTVYLAPQTTLDTLRRIAERAAKGSSLVIDYALRQPRHALLRRLAVRMVSRRFADQGEPWIGFLDPQEVAQEAKAMGWTSVDIIDHRGLNEMFFKGRRDRLRMHPFGGVIRLRL